MASRDTAARAPPKASTGMDHSEEMVAELDEPPDEMNHTYRTSYFWSPPKMNGEYMHRPSPFNRRESLLTRQLHSETEGTDDEHHHPMPGRALSTQSTFSNPSTTSTAELTSDDGHSVASPTVSPPLAPTHVSLPVREKALEQRLKIVGHEGMERKEAAPEKTVEAGLGRKRCITFACKSKPQEKHDPITAPAVTSPPVTSLEPQNSAPSSPPKRKCMIKFACPTRSDSAEKATYDPSKTTQRQASPTPLATNPSSDTQTTVKPKRLASPAPFNRRPSADAKAQAFRSHRGSDSTVTHNSPKASRKASVSRTNSIREDSQARRPASTRKYSNESDSDDREATRFHEFGTSEEEPEDWTRESTCHRSRLTLDDVLKKENVIRQACEEAEEEVVEEEEEEDEADEELDEQEDEMAALEEAEDDDGYQEDDEESEDSDEGFHSDNEAGFASSDDDGDSDYEWWKPGPSTAATSVEHLDRLAIVNAKPAEDSSVGSASSGKESMRSMRHRHRRHTKTHAMNIENRPPTPDLPDSTDFVCGTLDEDRPLEQAYITRKHADEAAKRKARPQDIDPSFPTSDPEMDEEDDDDVDEVNESEDEHEMMHGGLDNIHDVTPLRRTTSHRGRSRRNSHRSPPPPAHHSPAPKRRPVAKSPAPPKHHSPAPTKRRSVAKSPPPMTKRTSAKSPPPPTTKRTSAKSPPPPMSKRTSARSPPPVAKRGSARSPLPRKLFGQSPPMRRRSPGPPKRMMTSPPNSPTNGVLPLSTAPHLAERPRLEQTASLPRNGGGFMHRHLSALHQQGQRRTNSSDNHTTSHSSSTANSDDDDDAGTVVEVIPKRGAIDIVKGLEKKRRLRKEKLYQKHCAKQAEQAAKGEGPKEKRVKPGKGCERMRELGVRLGAYKGGRAEHILSL